MPTKSAPKPGTTTTVTPDDLNMYYRNPRRGDIDAIAASLKKLDQYKPLTGNIGTLTGRPNEILAGNHTLAAIRRLRAENPDDPRWRNVNVHWVDVDDDLAARIVVTDNRTSELGWFDVSELAAILESFNGDLEGISYSQDDLARLFPPDTEPPEGFPEFGDDIPTAYCCPKCNYEWSGKPK